MTPFLSGASVHSPIQGGTISIGRSVAFSAGTCDEEITRSAHLVIVTAEYFPTSLLFEISPYPLQTYNALRHTGQKLARSWRFSEFRASLDEQRNRLRTTPPHPALR